MNENAKLLWDRVANRIDQDNEHGNQAEANSSKQITLISSVIITIVGGLVAQKGLSISIGPKTTLIALIILLLSTVLSGIYYFYFDRKFYYDSAASRTKLLQSIHPEDTDQTLAGIDHANALLPQGATQLPFKIQMISFSLSIILVALLAVYAVLQS